MRSRSVFEKSGRAGAANRSAPHLVRRTHEQFVSSGVQFVAAVFTKIGEALSSWARVELPMHELASVYWRRL